MLKLIPFVEDRRGAELAEYAVGLALLVLLAILAYNVLGGGVNASMAGTGEAVKEAPQDPLGGGDKGKGCPNPPCGQPPPCGRPPCGNAGKKK